MYTHTRTAFAVNNKLYYLTYSEKICIGGNLHRCRLRLKVNIILYKQLISIRRTGGLGWMVLITNTRKKKIILYYTG